MKNIKSNESKLEMQLRKKLQIMIIVLIWSAISIRSFIDWYYIIWILNLFIQYGLYKYFVINWYWINISIIGILSNLKNKFK